MQLPLLLLANGNRLPDLLLHGSFETPATGHIPAHATEEFIRFST